MVVDFERASVTPCLRGECFPSDLMDRSGTAHGYNNTASGDPVWRDRPWVRRLCEERRPAAAGDHGAGADDRAVFHLECFSANVRLRGDDGDSVFAARMMRDGGADILVCCSGGAHILVCCSPEQLRVRSGSKNATTPRLDGRQECLPHRKLRFPPIMPCP